MEGKEEEFPPENFDTNANCRLCWERGEECVPVRDKALLARWDLRSLPDGLRPQVGVKKRHPLSPPRPGVRRCQLGWSRRVTSESLGGRKGTGFDRPPIRNEARRSAFGTGRGLLHFRPAVTCATAEVFFLNLILSRTYSADCAARSHQQLQCAGQAGACRPEPSRAGPNHARQEER